ncbi:MAG TPA: hypothetical protein DD416_00985, partial [Rhodobacteraceae bacterium]|nr:hypothetical protein [Paracoccaceae bacterium]
MQSALVGAPGLSPGLRFADTIYRCVNLAHYKLLCNRVAYLGAEFGTIQLTLAPQLIHGIDQVAE